MSADSNLASSVVNLPTSRRAPIVWPSFQVSLIQSNALSGSVDADITASLVRILQFLYDSAWGKAGTFTVSASLTLFFSCDWSLELPNMALMRRMNRWSLSSELYPSPSPSSSSPSPGPPPGGRRLPGGGFFPRLSLPRLLSRSACESLSSSGGSGPCGFPPASDGATLVGGYVGDLRPVISETGSLLSTGAFPSGSSISHISWLGSAGLDALADANDGNGAEYLTSVDGGIMAVAVWTIGIGIGPIVSRSLLILMFMDSVCNCWAFICSLCCLMMDSSWDICILRCSSWRS